MKKLLLILTLFVVKFGFSQYNNEWIDYTKTYYKFKIAATGLYRVNQTALPADIQSTPAQNFQLWRNGKEVTLFTSVASGALGAAGYIEFWGVKNDGVPDKPLYINPTFQLSDKTSLETDTATYFLTINTTSVNKRYSNDVNNVAGNVLPSQQYFMYTARNEFKENINRGHFQYLGFYLYSSSYDYGEMWSSNDISPSTPKTINFSNLNVYTSGPNASLRMSVAGTSTDNQKPIRASVNGINFDTTINGDDAVVFNAPGNANVNLASLANSTQIIFRNLADPVNNPTNRYVVGFAELTYPRTFNFGGESQFEFSLPATVQGYYLQITNFNAGTSTPVLYDLTNNRRYVGDVSGATIRFAIPADAARSFVLVGQSTAVTQLQQKGFVNYSLSQGDYLIISHSSLGYGANQPVENYRAYRSSLAGGGYNARIYDIDELMDQFAFGIRKHPLSVKNFLRWARASFTSSPKLALLIGKGVTYDEYYPHQSEADANKLNLVPTFGYPGSDILLGANGVDPVLATPIGRISAITPQEVTDYLQKVKEYELAQNNTLQTVANKAWMKTVVHVAGGANAAEDASISSDLNGFKNIIKDTLYGARVYDFNKTTTGTATTISDALFSSLLSNGIGLLTYFGHGSSSALNYNLPALGTWNNPGKYPFFTMLGCNVGNIFTYDPGRLTSFQTLSEKYILTPQTGGIGMLASTHFGVQGELKYYSDTFYNAIGRKQYNKPIANAIQQTTQSIAPSYFLLRMHLEQHILHGDPGIKANSFPKPDYTVEDPDVIISPSFISVADTAFSVKSYFHNLGKATGDTVGVEVKRVYPDGSSAVVYVKKIVPAVRNIDSVSFSLPIIPTRDKGQNKLIITIDYNFKYDELSETNNSVEKQFFIFESEARPVYPYNFAIINRNNAKLVASTADPVSPSQSYVMEIDTTEFFNSPIKITRTVTSIGGILEFDPGFTYQDNTVYHWRVALVPSSGTPHWNNSSFIYLSGTEVGFNQSNFYQHTKSGMIRIYLDSADRNWKFSPAATNLRIRNEIYQAGDGDSQFSISVNGDNPPSIRSACPGPAPKLIINVFDPVTMKPLYNQAIPSITQSGSLGGFMGSVGGCSSGREFNFEFTYADAAGRAQVRDFLDWIQPAYVVAVRNIAGGSNASAPFVSDWIADASSQGTGNTLYSRLKNAGFADLDFFTYARAFAFIYKKGSSSFIPQWQFTQSEFDDLTMNVNVPSPDTLGYIVSPKFGPAASWKEVKWRGFSLETPSQDEYNVKVVGIRTTGQADTLYTLTSAQQDFNISAVNAATYPYIQLVMFTQDKVNLTPYQLRWWRLFYAAVPEGALAANLKFTFKDTLEAGEPLNFAIPFKNVSDVAFPNTIKVKLAVTDRNNVQTTIPTTRLKAIPAGDTAMVNYQISTASLSGTNTLFLDVNPDNDQPEQAHFNNFLYKSFVVKGDPYKPTLDVTFDGVHILSGDIISSKPRVVIKLKDESKFLLLNDTSLVTLTLRYPDNGVRRFKFGTDTLKFISATSGTDNVATVEFTPTLPLDGDYELTVVGKDKSGNTAGNIEYRVVFQVYNTPMISNMFNYPNPFTTSTAFVFTLTGSVVPQYMKIQILTITGKIVREITKDELGPIHIGRNITEYKWDGKDQYGQSLANGVYLYRFATQLDGKSLDKFPTYDGTGSKVGTDQYFNKGYGKMYLMR
jgi:hypothetical protein